MCVCVCVCVCERERERECACVCVLCESSMYTGLINSLQSSNCVVPYSKQTANLMFHPMYILLYIRFIYSGTLAFLNSFF